jgi:Fungal Zn(2)-Cys(6) binuclear cluster domain
MPSVPCDACALRRVKCDGNNPCWICIKNDQPCTFLRVRRRRGPKGPRKSTKAKLEQFQAQLSLPRTDPIPDQRPISLAAYFTYLDVYKDALYTTWPIVSIDSLKSRLNDGRTIDYESYALAAALSAATIVQLKLSRSEAMTEASVMEAEDFVKECLRHRNQCNYQNTITINLLLTSLFLHMYYANTGQMNAATFALRETITYADLLRLGDSTTLDSLCRDERELQLRIFWVLFVTER